MKIYWRSKEGREAPPDARFSLFSFLGEELPLHAELVHTLPPPANPCRVLQRTDLPHRKEWIQSVEAALAEIASGHLQKVVLARETTLLLSEAVDPFQVTAMLPTEGAALFCLDLGDGRAFLGATPERLLQRSARTIQIEAMAATKGKGESEAEFLRSDKSLREFQFVQDYLTQTLASYCAGRIAFSPIGIHRTKAVSHLHTCGRAMLAPYVSETALVRALYPTPALCGTPKQEALKWICATESFARGFYGGVVGWSAAEEADWMVAIRCCFIEGHVAKLYTGTGIVAGSDPETEWDELEAKLSLYKDVFPCGL